MKNFWQTLAVFILNNRIAILIVMGLLTVGMLTQTQIELAQDYGKVVPPSDSDFIIYKHFKEVFGEDGNVIVVGIKGDIHAQAFFVDAYQLSEDIKKIPGVEGVLSIGNLVTLISEDSLERFRLEKIVKTPPQTQRETDSLLKIIENLPFYNGLIYADSGRYSLIAVSLNPSVLDSKNKVSILDDIQSLGKKFEEKHHTHLAYAGLPVFRATLMKTLPSELALFLLLALIVTALVLYIVFRSWVAVLVPILVTFVVIIWALGIQGILGYKLTVIMGIIPALVTVVGIPNCVYFLTKYHYEYEIYRDKRTALMHMIDKIGIVTVMVNATTVIGLGATGVTNIAILREFGIVSGLTVFVAFFISLFLITIIYSYLPAPTPTQLQHLTRKSAIHLLGKLDYVVQHYRLRVFGFSLLLLGISFWGMSKIEVVSKMMDDIPEGSRMMQDMKLMEEKFGGVMPFEILIDTKKKRRAQKPDVLQDIAALQDSIHQKFPEISRTLSIADIAKFARQSFYGGGTTDYDLPSKKEADIIMLHLKNSEIKAGNFSKTLTDDSLQRTRITGNIRDIGSQKMGQIIQRLQTDIDSLFEKDKYDVSITGTTRIYIKGNEYLISNLIQSLLLTLVLIGGLMLLTFRSLRMMLLSIAPNVLPLLMVAGFMGFWGIALKPSTTLIFSTVFGIAIDNTIHFLAAYRRHRRSGLGLEAAVSATFDNTGLSMIYTSSILFFGFIIFVASSFGGTKAMGLLVGGTLLVSLFSNLFLLPALVLTFDKNSIYKPLLATDNSEEEV